MPVIDPTRAKIAAIREHAARPTTMMIPDHTLFAKNSWPIPRKTALKAPSRLFALAASAAERSVPDTLFCVTWASAGATRPPRWPCP